ncbi:MAG: signal peptidase I [Treponema sp.]|nr:signal peptidase I [Treponema sp.]
MNKELLALSYSMKKRFQRKVVFFVVYFLSIFVVLNLIINFVFYSYKTKSYSMSPDIPAGSCIIFNGLDKNPSRGDVVLMNERTKESKGMGVKVLDLLISFFTFGQVTPSKLLGEMGKEELIRRVVGLPGDEVSMIDYKLYIKPKGEKHVFSEFELTSKTYNVDVRPYPAVWDMEVGVSGYFDPIILGDDEYFVLGDNRISCVDSRIWGPVKKSEIKASALFQFYPLDKIKAF